MTKTADLLILCAVLFLPLLCPASKYWYEERLGGEVVTTNCLTVTVAADRRVAVLSNRHGVSTLVTDPAGLRTLKSSSMEYRRGRSFEAVNRDNTLAIRIVRNGRTNRLSQGPLRETWIQDVSLIPLIKFPGLDTVLRQCAVHESTGKSYYLDLRRDGTETMEIGGRITEVVRVVQTARGVPRSLWSALYWYRESDGLLVREKAVFGGPGTQESISILIREE